MFHKKHPKFKTYKCNLGACYRIDSCGGGDGAIGEKLVEVKTSKEGLITEREEYYECAKFMPKETKRSILASSNSVRNTILAEKAPRRHQKKCPVCNSARISTTELTFKCHRCGFKSTREVER